MDRIRIVGGNTLNGTVQVGGAKNAALPILFASLLTREKCRFTRVPALKDIDATAMLMQEVGARVHWSRETSTFETEFSNSSSLEAPYDLVRKMRASFLILGPLLARFGKARVSLPGGCAIGARPVDFHLKALERLGAQIDIEEGYVNASATRLRGARVVFDYPSVGATEHLMMAASLAEGETVLENSAREPEIVDLARALTQMGARIEGAGSEKIYIQGVTELRGADFEIMGDRIEAGTYLCAVLACGGEVTVTGIELETLDSVLSVLESAGASIQLSEKAITIRAEGRPRAVDVTTSPFPGFPTDMQAQLMAALCCAEGTSTLSETVFENRFMHVPELNRLGASIQIKGGTAVVRGVDQLRGAPIMATDLRASASLVIAGLLAHGETVVSRIYHLDRGYERLEEKLSHLGATISRI